MNYTITGNCLNGHVVEEVSITRTGRESTGFSGGTAGTAELGYYNTREDKLCITESQTTGTNKPVYGSIA